MAAGLTIVIAVVAFRRLALYERAFGLTMLRLSCQVFAAWIVAVFVLLAMSFVGVYHRPLATAGRRAMTPATTAAAAITDASWRHPKR